MKTKKQCINCKEYPAWNAGFADEVMREKPVYRCGLCGFQLPRQVRISKLQKELESLLKG